MVSVIMPFYNTSLRLTETALRSVVAQRVPELEVVVVDDGSAPEFARGLGALIESLRGELDAVLLSQPNAGPAAARSRGVEAARHEIVALLDSDDRWAEGKLEAQLGLFASSSEVWMTCGGLEVVDESGAPVKGRIGPERARAFAAGPRALYLRLLAENPVNNITACFRRGPFRELGGYDQRFYCAEDRDLWLRACRREWRVHYVDEVLAYETDHGGKVSRRKDRRDNALRAILDRELHDLPAWLSELPRGEVSPALAEAWHRFGRLLSRAGDQRGAARAFAQAFRLRPAASSAWRWFAAAVVRRS